MTNLKEVKQLYEAEIVFNVPNNEGKKLDFSAPERAKEIMIAIERYNKNFTEKELKIKEINRKNIVLLMGISNHFNNTSRNISFFSKRMYHDFEWSKYSREKSKLFSVERFTELTQYPEKIMDYENMRVFPERYCYALEKEINDNILTDEQAQEAFDALIKIQNLGNKETVIVRKEAIAKIKFILKEVLE